MEATILESRRNKRIINALRSGTAAVSTRQLPPEPSKENRKESAHFNAPAEHFNAPAEKPQRVIVLRAATARDLTQLHDCLIRYFDEVPLAYPNPVEGDAIAWGLNIVNRQGCVVAECDGKIIGSVGLDVCIYPWNHANRYLNAVWFFVVPEFRKGWTGIKLAKAAQEIADRKKLHLRMDEVWKYLPAGMEKMKKRLGFHHVGGNYVYLPREGV